MENIKHTPGPWDYSMDTQMIFSLDKNGQADKGIASFTNEADAKLIAAAPDLLEAVRSYLTLINDEGCIPDVEQIELTNKMRNALKKATE